MFSSEIHSGYEPCLAWLIPFCFFEFSGLFHCSVIKVLYVFKHVLNTGIPYEKTRYFAEHPSVRQRILSYQNFQRLSTGFWNFFYFFWIFCQFNVFSLVISIIGLSIKCYKKWFSSYFFHLCEKYTVSFFTFKNI